MRIMRILTGCNAARDATRLGAIAYRELTPWEVLSAEVDSVGSHGFVLSTHRIPTICIEVCSRCSRLMQEQAEASAAQCSDFVGENMHKSSHSSAICRVACPYDFLPFRFRLVNGMCHCHHLPRHR